MLLAGDNTPGFVKILVLKSYSPTPSLISLQQTEEGAGPAVITLCNDPGDSKYFFPLRVKTFSL